MVELQSLAWAVLVLILLGLFGLMVVEAFIVALRRLFGIGF